MPTGRHPTSFLQVLRPCHLAQLAGLISPSIPSATLSSPSPAALSPQTPHRPRQPGPASSAAGTLSNADMAASNAELAETPRECTALRLARYAARRVGVVQALLHRLATIPETIEMARATGLTMGQVRASFEMRKWEERLSVLWMHAGSGLESVILMVIQMARAAGLKMGQVRALFE